MRPILREPQQATGKPREGKGASKTTTMNQIRRLRSDSDKPLRSVNYGQTTTPKSTRDTYTMPTFRWAHRREKKRTRENGRKRIKKIKTKQKVTFSMLAFL